MLSFDEFQNNIFFYIGVAGNFSRINFGIRLPVTSCNLRHLLCDLHCPLQINVEIYLGIIYHAL
jgi:hypothetical protein